MSESPSQPPGPTRDGKISTTLIDHDHLCRMVAANIRGSSADREVAEQPGAAPGNSLVGRSIDRYRIEAEIGRGGMSVVYRALDTTLERPVAVKVIQERYQNKGLPERLRREATLSARLTHPNIIAVHDLGEWRLGDPPHPAPYIVMDLVDGGTFRDAFDRLPISSRLEILQRIAQAVGHAHEQGVIHRDLKPSNILLRKDGWPLLADFGLAREAIDLSRWTRTGEVLGTPDYMAPEQVRGERDRVGPATDIWALGVLTYEALTDHLPFRAPHPGQVLQAILQDNPVPVRRLVPGIPEPLEAICRRALDKDLERRFGSAREFSGALEHWIAGESDPIHSLTALDRTGILTPLEPSDPRSAGGQAIASPRRSRIQWLVAGAGSVLLLLALMLALRPGEPENQIPGPVPDDLLWRMKHELVVDPDASLRVLGSLEDHLLLATNTTLAAHDIETGIQVWRRSTTDFPDPFQLRILEGHLWVVTEHAAFALEPGTGKNRWDLAGRLDPPVLSAGALTVLFSSRALYAHVKGRGLARIDEEGRPQWWYPECSEPPVDLHERGDHLAIQLSPHGQELLDTKSGLGLKSFRPEKGPPGRKLSISWPPRHRMRLTPNARQVVVHNGPLLLSFLYGSKGVAWVQMIDSRAGVTSLANVDQEAYYLYRVEQDEFDCRDLKTKELRWTEKGPLRVVGSGSPFYLVRLGSDMGLQAVLRIENGKRHPIDVSKLTSQQVLHRTIREGRLLLALPDRIVGISPTAKASSEILSLPFVPSESVRIADLGDAGIALVDNRTVSLLRFSRP